MITQFWPLPWPWIIEHDQHFRYHHIIKPYRDPVHWISVRFYETDCIIHDLYSILARNWFWPLALTWIRPWLILNQYWPWSTGRPSKRAHISWFYTTLTIYPSVLKQLIWTLFEAHIVPWIQPWLILTQYWPWPWPWPCSATGWSWLRCWRCWAVKRCRVTTRNQTSGTGRFIIPYRNPV